MDLRKFFWSKIFALGFIFLIILANIWVGIVLFGAPTPLWIEWGFVGGMIWIAVSAVGVLIQIAAYYFKKKLIYTSSSFNE